MYQAEQRGEAHFEGVALRRVLHGGDALYHRNCGQRQEVESQGHLISIRLKVAEEKKSRRAKPAHKEGEAIQFEFNLDSDDCVEVANNMVRNIEVIKAYLDD